MAQTGRPGLTVLQKKELWRRWRDGQSLSEIGRALDNRLAGSIYGVIKARGGFGPPERRRSRLALGLTEREEISRGVARGEPARQIAGRLGRATSTVTRELTRHGGRRAYRAARADDRAWDRGRRPKLCRLATNGPLGCSEPPGGVRPASSDARRRSSGGHRRWPHAQPVRAVRCSQSCSRRNVRRVRRSRTASRLLCRRRRVLRSKHRPGKLWDRPPRSNGQWHPGCRIEYSRLLAHRPSRTRWVPGPASGRLRLDTSAAAARR